MKIGANHKNIYLIGRSPENSPAELKELFPNKKICVCDFYVKDCEQGEIDSTGVINYSDLLIVDHHAPIPDMMQHISSTVFANQYVSTHGALNDEYVILINHIDTDSLFSALLMNGELKPTKEYGLAAIAADHTGEENILGDILQALEDDRDLAYSIDVLMKVLKKRIWARQALKARVENHEYEMIGGIAHLTTNDRLDAALLPSLFPHAKAVALTSPMPKHSARKWRIRVRLGISVENVALNQIDLPHTGGRWNAISTSRDGGTAMEPAEYLKLVAEGIEKQQNTP